ncbi:hypothetical protein Emag_007321 [Eimeria magna]
MASGRRPRREVSALKFRSESVPHKRRRGVGELGQRVWCRAARPARLSKREMQLAVRCWRCAGAEVSPFFEFVRGAAPARVRPAPSKGYRARSGSQETRPASCTIVETHAFFVEDLRSGVCYVQNNSVAPSNSEPVLAHPDYTRPFYLDCDGSGDGLGAVLLQPYDEGERVVAYASRSLLDHERKWTATELEAAALIWALETFRHYIDTIEVCIRTDHAPLEYIRHNSSQCRRLERWALRLQEFRFKVIHRPGAQQKHADCLSRAPRPPNSHAAAYRSGRVPLPYGSARPRRAPGAFRSLHIVSIMLPIAPTGGCASCGTACATCARRSTPVAHRSGQWTSVSSSEPGGSDDDTDVQVCLTDSDEDSPTPPMAQLPADAPSKVVHGGRNIPLPPAVEHLSLKDAQAQDPECQKFLRLARTPRDALPRVVLPAIFRSRAIQAHHLSYYGGHFGVFKTAARLACRYWWPHLQRDVRAYFRRCPFCIANTDAPRKWKWLNLPIGTPFELIAIDLFGPLPLTRRGNNHILVIIDHHTRWVELVPLPNPTAAQVAQALFNEWISRWGVPRALLSDNGPQFTAELLRQLCTTFGISKLFASPYNPRGNSIVESYMRSLKTTLRLCLQHFRQGWDVVLPAAALAYRCTPHSVTRFSPFFLVTGQELGPPCVSAATANCRGGEGAGGQPASRRTRPCRFTHRTEQRGAAEAAPMRFQSRFDACTRSGSETREQPQSKQFTGHSREDRAATMQSPPHTRSRAEREGVVEIEPPHSTASQQTVQQSSPAAVPPAPAPSAPAARKRERAEPAEPRIVKFVVGKFRPSDLKDIKNAKKKLAKPQTQKALQHREIIYLHRRLKAYRGARKEVWKVAKGLLRLPVERGWTPPPESLVARMKGQVEDSPAVEEIWDEWPSPFAKLERQWDDIYLAEFPEVTAAPRWGTPSWTSFLTAFSRQFIARPSARVREIRGWKEIPEYEPEIQPDPNPVRFISAALQALGGLLAPRTRLDEEDSDEQSSRRCRRLRPQHRARRHRGRPRLHRQRRRLGNAPDRARCRRYPQSRSWILVIQRGAVAALMGSGRIALREFFNGVYRTGQALLGATVAAAAPAAPVADPAAPPQPATPVRSVRVDHPSRAPSTPGEATPPPPPPDPSVEEFRLPEPAAATRSPPLQLGMDGLLNGSAGRSPAGDESVPPVSQEPRSATELSETEQPAPKRVRAPGR